MVEHDPLCESNHDLTELKYRCQFCEQSSPIAEWTNERQTCPKCGEDYSWLLAQDSEE